MPHIEKQAAILAARSEVFAFLAERNNAPKLVPNLVRVWEIHPSEAGVGQNWKFEYRLLGITFQGTAEMIAFQHGERLQFKTTGKLDSTWTYTVADDGEHCRVTIAVDYDLPDTLWAKVKDRVAYSRINEAQVEHLLTNLAAQFL